ncbi:MAG: MFS transporter [Pseudomonadales bacterium]
MYKTVFSVWSLFLGIALMGVNVGAQNTLLGIRAAIEGFSSIETGWVMSSYYVGFLLGSINTVRIINAVGHVRTFAALTAILSITILLHAIIVDIWVWSALRFFSGLAACGIFIVAESWLNQVVTNRQRGALFAIYFITISLGMVAGQFLLRLSGPESFEIFAVVSVIISLAGIPILLTPIQTPTIIEVHRISPLKLIKLAPAGALGVMMSGVCLSIIFGLGPVYATRANFSVDQVSLFMTAIIAGSILSQWPLGKWSDHHDRRIVTASAAFVATAVAVVSIVIVESDIRVVYFLAFLLGATILPLYSLFNAVAMDYVDPKEMVSAGATLIMFNGMGAVVGPLYGSVFMSRVGSDGFFWAIASFSLLMCVFCIYRAVFFPISSGEKAEFHITAPAAVGSMLEVETDPNAEEKL